MPSLSAWILLWGVIASSSGDRDANPPFVEMTDGEVSFVFKPVCFAPLLAIDSRINNPNVADQKIVNNTRKELMEISKAQTIHCESSV